MDDKDKRRRPMACAEKRRRESPGAWRCIEGRAVREAHSRRVFGIKQLAEEARRKGFAASGGSRARTGSSLTPALARTLVAEHPGTRRFMVPKRPVSDGAE